MDELEKHVEKFLKKLSDNDFMVMDVKDISYGKQIIADYDLTKYIFRIYYSKKNGIKEDYSQIKNKDIFELLGIEPPEVKTEKEKDAKVYPADFDYFSIGSDETGKGDFIGPLFVGAVYVDDFVSKTLKREGVKDSKKITSFKTLEDLYQKITTNAYYSVMTIEPLEYNELYEKYKNINKVLEYAHKKNMNDLLEKIKDQTLKKIIIDKFSYNNLFDNFKKNVEIIELPKGEQFTSVAAASIVARYTQLKYFEELNKKYKKDNIEFKIGVNENTIIQVKKFVECYSFDDLKYIVKLHFKTIEEIK